MPNIRVNDLRGNNLGLSTQAIADEIARSQRLPGEIGTLKATMWTVPSGDGSDNYSFTFPFQPQQIQYNNMSPELTEIARPGKVPIIAFNRFRAKQVVFKFLIAHPQDGLNRSIDDSIQELQRLISIARPVYFTNMDKQLTSALLPETGIIRRVGQIFWSIVDFNLSSIRRNADNKIVAAEANITLVETNNPIISAAELPKISYTRTSPSANRSSGGDKGTGFTYGLWSSSRPGIIGGNQSQSVPSG